MKRFKAWLIRSLGGHVTERKVFVEYEKISYQGLGRPFDLSDWERLATMHSWAETFMRFVAFQLQQLDEEEGRVKYAPELDRERLAISIRRAVLRDLQKLPDQAAARVAAAYNQAQEKAREKGLSNHGK